MKNNQNIFVRFDSAPDRVVQRFDRYTLDSKKATRTPEGYLDVPLLATRTGTFDYGSHWELRPEGEVFKKDSLESCQNLPVTNTHPTKLLDSKSAKEHTVGFQTSVPERSDEADGESYLGFGIRILDEKTVLDVEAGRVTEVSMGYKVRLDFTEGEYKGQKFDAIQRDIRYNHIALVSKGRAGSRAKLRLDSDFNQILEQEENMFELKFDGKTYKVGSEAEAHALLAMLNSGKENKSKLDALTAKHDALVLEKGDAAEHAKTVASLTARVDKETAKADGLSAKVTELESKLSELSDPAKLDAAVKERISLVSLAEKVGIKSDESAKLDDAGLKKAIILANNKSVNLEGKNDGYIEASIDFIRESFQNKTDAAKNSGSAFVNTDSASNMDAMEKLEKARQEKIAADKNRWKEPLKK